MPARHHEPAPRPVGAGALRAMHCRVVLPRRLRQRDGTVRHRLLLRSRCHGATAPTVPRRVVPQHAGRNQFRRLRGVSVGQLLPGGLYRTRVVPAWVVLPAVGGGSCALPDRVVRQQDGAAADGGVPAVLPRPLLRRPWAHRPHRLVRPWLLLLAGLVHVAAAVPRPAVPAIANRVRRPVPTRWLLPRGLVGTHPVPTRHLPQRHRRLHGRRLHHVHAGLLLCVHGIAWAHWPLLRRLLLRWWREVAHGERGAARHVHDGGCVAACAVCSRHLQLEHEAGGVPAVPGGPLLSQPDHHQPYALPCRPLLHPRHRVARAMPAGHLLERHPPGGGVRVPAVPARLLLPVQRPDRAVWQVQRRVLLHWRRDPGAACAADVRRPVPCRPLLRRGLVRACAMPPRHVLQRPRHRQRGQLPALPSPPQLQRHGTDGLQRRLRARVLLRRRRHIPDALPDRRDGRHLPPRALLSRRVERAAGVRAELVHEQHRRVGVPIVPRGVLLPRHGAGAARAVPDGQVLPRVHGRHALQLRNRHVRAQPVPPLAGRVLGVHAWVILCDAWTVSAHGAVRRWVLLPWQQHQLTGR